MEKAGMPTAADNPPKAAGYAPGEGDNVLEARDIIMEFSGVRVLHGVDFFLRRGEVHALLGENGAGKSTMMKIIAGVYRKTAGSLLLRGKEVDFKNRHDADAHGIGIVFQEFSQVPQLSVVDNLFLGKEIYKKAGGLFSRLDHKEMERRAKVLLDRFGVTVPLHTPVKELGVANQQLIEICKALFYNADILIMDEPTAALSEGEIEKLFAMIRELKRQGVSIVYISHKLEEIKVICDRASIIRDGRNVATLPMTSTSIPEIVRLMVGKEMKEIYPEKKKTEGGELLRLEKLSSGAGFSDISFSLGAGEILGITGLVGAGKTEIARAIFGMDPKYTGDLYIEGRPVRMRSPRQARDLGIAMVPEDRKRQGVVLLHSAADNICLPNLKRYCYPMGMLNLSRCTKEVQHAIDRVAVRPADPAKRAYLFSGGNQQKIVIAKWIRAGARIYIFDEPTRGVDIGAKSEIYKLIADLAASGCGIIVCSSDIYEILGVCHRILVMRKGRAAGITDDAEDSARIILKAQLGNEENTELDRGKRS